MFQNNQKYLRQDYKPFYNFLNYDIVFLKFENQYLQLNKTKRAVLKKTVIGSFTTKKKDSDH